MGLNQILSTGRSSLIAHQTAIATASHNTANADVVGYSKRDVTFASRPGRTGVDVESVRRRTDEWMTARIREERAKLGAQASQSEGLGSLELQLGDFEGGLGAAMDQFFSSLRTLQSSPADILARNDLLAQAQTLAETFNLTASRIDREQQRADETLGTEIEETNAMLLEIAALNEAIRTPAAGTEPSHDLDRRDLVITELSQKLEITALSQEDGTITVLLAGGRPLVQAGSASQLAMTPDATYAGLSRLDLVSPSGTTSDITTSLSGGELGGLLDLRDGFLADTGSRLDDLAFDLATNFNAVHQLGFGLDGVTGRDFFTPPAAAAGTAATLAVDPNLAGDARWVGAATTVQEAVGGNDNLLALAALADANIAAGGTVTLAQEYAGVLSSVGSTVATQKTALRQAEIQVDQLESIKESNTGVSIDEELIDITRFERAFQAASRVLQTADQMFDVLMQI